MAMLKTLVILAAGTGSRYGGLKQFEPVGPAGEFILDYAVYDAVHAGFNRIVFVIRKEMVAHFESTVGSRINAVVPVEYAFQDLMQVPEGVFVPAFRKKPWGGGHALLAARPFVNSAFCVINAHDYYGRNSFEVMSGFMENTVSDDALYGMVNYKLSSTLRLSGGVSRGVCSGNQDGYLERIVERDNVRLVDGHIHYTHTDGSVGYLSGGEQVSLNMWAFKPSVFAHLESEFRLFLDKNCTSKQAEFTIVDVVDRLLRSGHVRIRMHSCSEPSFGMTNPDDRDDVQQRIGLLVEKGVYPASLWMQA